jgi:hypothetical protein
MLRTMIVAFGGMERELVARMRSDGQERMQQVRNYSL